ncbi:hypothetical protein [Krasilnikovia sp. M28-CT-15]|uniref:hypothetical protein n=1 Tax=Krasilnikovia sp. M28-CT-15 TaxID=3373540 RepID=UPI003876EA53
MSASVARLIAVPFALLAFALRVVTEFWVSPLALPLRPWPVSLAATVAAALAAVLIPLGGFWLCTRPAWRRPAAWGVDAGRRRFVADLTPRWAGPQAVLVGWLGGGMVPHERVPGTDRVRIADLGVATDIWIVLAVVTLVAGVALVLAGRPRLILDPHGVTLRALWTRRRFGWDELVPGGPPPQAKPNPRVITLYRCPPAGSPGPLLPWHLSADRLHVDPAFLALSLRRYLDHPEHRSAIGTAGELVALHDSSTSPMPAAPPRG